MLMEHGHNMIGIQSMIRSGRCILTQIIQMDTMKAQVNMRHYMIMMDLMRFYLITAVKDMIDGIHLGNINLILLS